MPDIKSPKSIRELPVAIVTQMIALATSGFGVVVALAWNEVIKNTVDQYIRPYFGQGSGVISLLIYAVVVTVLAVLVTMQLTRLQATLEIVASREKRQEQNLKKQKKSSKS